MDPIISKILFVLVIFVTNAIQAITGFAGTLLAMPPSLKLVGPDEAKAILNIMAMVSCFFIVIRNLKYVQWKILFRIILFMGIGMVGGMYIYKVASLDILLYIYGGLIVAIALKNLFVKGHINLPGFVMIIVLLAAGIIHGMFVSGGSLLVVYGSAVLKDKNHFRATIAPVWVILNFFMMFEHIGNGYFTKEVTILTFICLIPMFLGVFAGNKLHDKIKQSTFMKLTYVLLLISGLLCFV